MEDQQIIELYFQRDERAISETAEKYGGFCTYIAMNILSVKGGCRGVCQRYLLFCMEADTAYGAGGV